MLSKEECLSIGTPYAADMVQCNAPTVNSTAMNVMASGKPVSTSKASTPKVSQFSNLVVSPSHYVRLQPEPIDVIESWGLNWHIGNILKYLVRAGHKGDEIEDLRKAAYLLERYIALRKQMMSGQMELPFNA